MHKHRLLQPLLLLRQLQRPMLHQHQKLKRQKKPRKQRKLLQQQTQHQLHQPLNKQAFQQFLKRQARPAFFYFRAGFDAAFMLFSYALTVFYFTFFNLTFYCPAFTWPHLLRYNR
jgi:hypothetical protein